MSPYDTIRVIGHRHPDLDAIASAIGYAWLLNQTDQHAQPARLGAINAQTRFALDHFGVSVPELLPDVYVTIADVIEAHPTLNTNATRDQWLAQFSQTRRPIPIIDADHRPIGLVSAESLLSDTPIDRDSLILRHDQRLSDLTARIARTDQDYFITIDDAGRYLGLCHRPVWFDPPKQRLVLVDHNEISQTVIGVHEAEIIEIIDHHRLNAPPTEHAIPIQIAPIGSCSTLIEERIQAADHPLPAPIAGVLLAGILSDTLTFQSPTTTPRDHRAAERLAKRAQVEDLRGFGALLLAAGAGLGTRPADEILQADLKFYPVGDQQIALGQAEITDFAELDARLSDLQAALIALVNGRDLALGVLMITNIVSGDSRLLTAGTWRERLPFARLGPSLLDAPQIVSRKKQLLPLILAALHS
ncbi:MAG: DHH family phosphoesterase [Anaerolineae bacterium]|jgi:manganese-dependent inorganic pyrophosphatase|nr:DHH family phosphoesterase [Anaerolineae bacterium]